MKFYIKRSIKSPRYWLYMMEDKANNVCILGTYSSFMEAKRDFLNSTLKGRYSKMDYIHPVMLSEWGVGGRYSRNYI